ncbi:MAG: LPS assembly protein LptD [Gammaproteobacteria bacterium]|nr:LPS assembly protein LptD [Gammaproteobacteria bacterium]QOJ32425.1 MAG: LPS assembly protein LptD [Gammaproteobacteria bacterium]
MPDLGPVDSSDPRIDVITGHAEMDLQKGAVFDDEIRIRRGDGVLTAPNGRFDRQTGEFLLENGLRYRSPQSAVSGSRASFDTRSNSLEIEDADFDLFTVPSRGSAGAIAVDQGDVLTLRDVTYTTCARGHEDWLLRASQIRIDRDSGMATARNARLEFKGVPILYTPWITYPVTNERQSGFLLPALGRSETRGVEFQIPYYLNLAPNYDATLTPRYMSRRGTELLGEFRYLWPGHKGDVEGEYLPSDKVTGDNRYLLGIDHQSLLGRGWRATVDARTVSDSNYFEDLYGSTAATSQTHLLREASVEYFDNVWSLLGRVQGYQTLDESLTAAEKPYRRLPQLAASGYLPRGALGLDWSFDGELALFDRDEGLNGSRLHLSPGIALPLDYRGLWLKPAVAVEYTAYSIHNPAPGEHDGPSSATPIISIDMGAAFERGVRGNGWLQTLEPRAQFVHIPYRDQADQPVFDTIQPDFNLVQLFRKNRFLGYDRVGDTDQLNLGLTSRVLDATGGGEYLTATIGQTRFFSKQDVTLPGDRPVDSNASDWLAELGVTFNQYWKLGAGYQWGADSGRTQRTQLALQYRRDGQRVVNAAYRYRRDSLEEVDVSAAWPLSSRWSAVGRYDYSLRDNEVLERFVGFEYQNCCWGFRVVYRDYIASRTGDSDTAIAVQLILKGLTNVGDPAGRQLERGILGYEAD